MDEQGDSSFPNWPEFRRLFAYDNLLGKVLQGRYEVVRRLGAGGMGVVFLARHIHLDKHFALKIISPRFLDEPEIAARFLLEARAASKIDHPNVVNITDFGPPEAGPAFFAMEHLDGEDLAKLLAREGPLPWPRALAIVQQIARALVAAHQRGVVHRDIKPQNCLRITRDDNTDFIKVLDFGLAKVLSGTGKSAWTVGGSPGYIAPEIYRGGKTDHRVDLFALGALLHTLLIGRLPAQKPEDVDLPPGAPVRHAADLPPPLRALIARASHEDPDQRHPSAEAFLDDLEATRAALEHPAVPVPSAMPVQPRRWPLALAAAAALALTVTALQLRRPAADDATQITTPPARPVPEDIKPVPPDTSSANPRDPAKPVPSDTSTSPAPPSSASPVPSDTSSASADPAPPVPSDTSSASPTPPVPSNPSPAPANPPAPASRPRPPAPFDAEAARAVLQRQADGLAACKAGSSFRGVATRVRLDGTVTVSPRGKATVALPPGYDVNACVERLVEGLQFKPSATGGRIDHVFLL